MRLRLQVRDKYNDVVSMVETGETTAPAALANKSFRIIMADALDAGHLILLEDLDAKA